MTADIDRTKQYTYSDEPDEQLKRRADDMASDLSSYEDQRRSYLCFDVHGASYALESSVIRQVLHARTIVPVPFAPPCIRGIAHHEGVFLSVIDLAALVTGVATNDAATHLLVLADDESHLSIATESVPFTTVAQPDEIHSPREAAPSWIADLLDGVLVREGRPVGILSVRYVVNHPRLRDALEAQETREPS